MCITEGLACGKPILCYENVGVANEFEHGVLRVPFKNEAAFIRRIKDFWANKEYEDYRYAEKIQLLRSQVETHTWQNFVAGHDDCWESLA